MDQDDAGRRPARELRREDAPSDRDGGRGRGDSPPPGAAGADADADRREHRDGRADGESGSAHPGDDQVQCQG
ncbi:hypothetical protein F8M49_08440 [Rhodococcus zopfii]|uniref:Uncharacterized protein n=1 Tax=Rhodococcus zopfii TaxID=43772 RepID=A0ABU3WN68_9NOCA|nr:hypothetical protein [Rhodococcus zopfii]